MADVKCIKICTDILDDLDNVLREIQQWKEYKRQANMGYNVYPMFRRLDYGNNKSK